MTDIAAQYRDAIGAVRPDLAGLPMVLHTRGWEEAQLAKHSRTEIVVENLRYLDRPRSRHATTPEEDVPLLVRRV